MTTALADRIRVLRRQLAGIRPYALVVNQPLARRREQILGELAALAAGSGMQIDREDDHGRTERSRQ